MKSKILTAVLSLACSSAGAQTEEPPTAGPSAAEAVLSSVSVSLEQSGLDVKPGMEFEIDVQTQEKDGAFASTRIVPTKLTVLEKDSETGKLKVSVGGSTAYLPYKAPAISPAFTKELKGTNFKAAAAQSLLFTAIEHGVRMSEDKTRREIKGNFFGRYADAVSGANFKKFNDGGKIQSDWGHVMMGDMLGHIRCQNSEKCLSIDFGMNSQYWKEKGKNLAWSAAWSAQFEIGPFSEASLGHVTGDKMTLKDFIVTPVLGTAAQVGFDAYDKATRKWQNSPNKFVRVVTRLVNIDRTASEALAFRNPFGGKR